MTLSTDRTMRMLGLYRAAEQSEALLPDDTRVRLEAYAAGVNAYLDGHSGAWPPEFEVLRHRPEPWRVADFAGLGPHHGAAAQQQLLDGVPALPPVADADAGRIGYADAAGRRRATGGEPAVRTGGPGQPAGEPRSHSPAVARRLQQFRRQRQPHGTGAPILANDPHLSLDSPIVWYLVRIETPEHLLVGATSPGGPFVIIGHNGRLAWSLTTTHSDTQDLFLEKLDPSDPARYSTPDGTAAFETAPRRSMFAAPRMSVHHPKQPARSDPVRSSALSIGSTTAMCWP